MNEKYKNRLQIGGTTYEYYDIRKLAKAEELQKLPYTIRILLEGAIRNLDGYKVTEEHIDTLLYWKEKQKENCKKEIPFIPSRIILQDFTGVPAIVDLAAMRDECKRAGKNPSIINPNVKVDLIIDHSLMVDESRGKDAFLRNIKLEFQRNRERYSFLKWAMKSFRNLTVHPPGEGIIHQINLERLAEITMQKREDGTELPLLYPDTLVGTDSHSTMINGLGVLGFGVGGIEAEAAMLGQAVTVPMPKVIGVRLKGKPSAGISSTDISLYITHVLRKHKVVGSFVEYFGEGAYKMSLTNRATIANMCPEYGATMGYFPVDEESLRYMRETGRSEEQLTKIREYYKANLLFREDGAPVPEYSEVIEIELSEIRAAIAGPKRPQDLLYSDQVSADFAKQFAAQSPSMPAGGQTTKSKAESGEAGSDTTGASEADSDATGASEAVAKAADEARCGAASGSEKAKSGRAGCEAAGGRLSDGDIVLAAITSCTNTSNPHGMMGAGLLAKKALALGLQISPNIKCSMTPGSKAVSSYLERAGLMEALEGLGFYMSGYGCATCIGNSGPLLPGVSEEIRERELTVSAVLSGNRNFEGRIHPDIKANYLASPMLVIAYALKGTVLCDIQKDALGKDARGRDIFLKDIFPTDEEIDSYVKRYVTSEVFSETEQKELQDWLEIEAEESPTYPWDKNSSYIREAEFFRGIHEEKGGIPLREGIRDARVLAFLGDSVTTDHISPAGNIKALSPAGIYLKGCGIDEANFNSYGSRRGNHEVMMRGTFANTRIKNKLVSGIEGGFSRLQDSEEVKNIFDVAMEYKERNIPVIILAGKEYGTGSSRDWAAKGPFLQGVRAVIAESFERIHRSNLIGMGILPLRFKEGENAESLGLSGLETYNFEGLEELSEGQTIKVEAKAKDGSIKSFEVISSLENKVEIDYYKNGGILHKVLRDLIGSHQN